LLLFIFFVLRHIALLVANLVVASLSLVYYCPMMYLIWRVQFCHTKNI